MSLRFFRVQQRDRDIVHVRPGRPGDDQAVDGLERVIRVVVLQNCVQIEARSASPQVPDRQAATIAIIRKNARRFEAGEPLLNLMKPSDAVSGTSAGSGWARMMNSGLTKEQIAAMPPDKVLGERGWSDPSEWM